MIKKTAVLMDGGFVSKIIGRETDPGNQAAKIARLAEACLKPDAEELFRLYYYDCAPYGGKRDDLAGNTIDFRLKAQFKYQTALLKALAVKEYAAVRLGQVKFRGWKPRKHVPHRVRHFAATGGAQLGPRDFEPNFQQKGVDMRIGLDVATLSMNHLVDRIVLVAADSDFIPAMKLARREGIQIVLVTLNQSHVPELLEHADFYREPDLALI